MPENSIRRKDKKAMALVFTMIINDDAQGTIHVNACSNEGGSATITACTLQEAQELLSQGAEKLNEAMQNWKPEGQEEPATDPKHLIKRSMEEKTATQEYEESTQGKRFIKAIEQAKDFTFKRYSGLKSSQLNYIADKYRNNLVNGSFDLVALAYKQGYIAGKAGR